LAELVGLAGLAGGLVVDGEEYLTIGEVLVRLHAAGFRDKESTLRRLIDAGELDSYRDGPRRRRRVSSASVDALIARRRSPEDRTPS
jgi:excisionase family DNA binding protein